MTITYTEKRRRSFGRKSFGKKSNHEVGMSSLINPDLYAVKKAMPKGSLPRMTQPMPLKDLEAKQHDFWERIHAKEQQANRGEISQQDAEAYRNQQIKAMRALRTDISPFVYRTTIGHYGGMFVEVPEDRFEQFKALWPPGEFPKKVETKDLNQTNGPQGLANIRRLFPNSNGRVKQVFFAEHTAGLQRLELSMDLPNGRETNPGD